MAKKAKRPEQFDVLPSALLRQALVESLPDGTKYVWERVGRIRVTGEGLAALDALSCHPRYLADEATLLDWPYEWAELAVRFAKEPDGTRSRVLAVLVAAPADKLPKSVKSCEWEDAGRMSINSATGVIGDFARMLSECKAGGARARVLVGKGTASTAAQKKARQKAAQVLRKIGLPVADATPGDASPITFSTGLSDEQIEAARAALAESRITEEIWVPSAHTAMLLGDELLAGLLTLYPRGDDPWLLGYQTGFGDGGYEWQAIMAGDTLCGYLCDFCPTEESEAAAEVESSPASPAGTAQSTVPVTPVVWPVFPADLAPALTPGVAVAAKRGLIKNWFLAKLTGKSETGYRVLFPHFDEMEVSPTEVAPIPDRQVFKEGDLVAFHSPDTPLRAGVVRSVTKKSCKVQFRPKDPLVEVPVGDLTFQEWLVAANTGVSLAGPAPAERQAVELPAPADAAPAFGPGVIVAARRNKKWRFPGRITQAGRGGYHVQFPSGDQELIKETEIAPMPDRHVFRNGDAVCAVWSNAAMYPGRITGVTNVGYVVTWNDGSAPEIVPLGLLTFLAWT